METKHTPGPWEIHNRASTTVCLQSGRCVAACGGWCDNRRNDVLDEQQANARLIAAAPELLEFAHRIEKWEAKLLRCNAAWENSLPRFTQEIYDEWMELQSLRNGLIAKATQATERGK